MAWTKTEIREAREALRKMLPKGSKLHTVLRGVSRSGMTRWIDVYKFDRKGGKLWLSRLVAKAVDFTFDERREAVKVEGCGMDMGFHLVNSLSYAIHGAKNFNPRCKCGRDACKHTSGYTLKQEWI